MSYRFDRKDISILTQVAFKESYNPELSLEDNQRNLAVAVDVLVDAIKNGCDQYVETQAPAAPATNGGSFNAEAALVDGFGATVVDQGADIRIINKDADATGEPIPADIIAKMVADGVTAVFDNRATRKGRQPHFKSDRDSGGKGYWID